MSLITRLASGHDAAGISRLCALLGYPVPDAVMRVRLEQLVSSPNHIVVVAEQDATLHGWISGELRMSLESGTRVELTGLIVDSTMRRAGIGRRLVAEIERWALDRDCAEVMVRSNVARLESHPFYERLGYKLAKTQHAYRRVLDAAQQAGLNRSLGLQPAKT